MSKVRRVLPLALVFLLSVCAVSATDWLQFGFTPDKTANNTAESEINTSNVSTLTPLFSVPLPAADNTDGAPALITGVSTPSGVRDLVLIAGAHGHITAFDANSGATVWTKVFAGGGSNNVGPAIDLNRMFVYFSAPDGSVHKLNVGDGSEVTSGGWPISLGTGKAGAQLTIATAKNGHTYLYATHHGHGHLVTIDLADASHHVFNLACSQFPDVLDPAGCTERGANPWSRANPFVPALDRVLVGTGTNDGTHWVAGSIWRQSWVALPADGSTQMTSGGGFPADSYTPTDWASSVASDRDICSGGLAILPAGLSSKFPHLAVNPGKDAKIRLLNLDNMSGQGGPGHLGGEIQLLNFPTGSLMRAESAVWTNPADGKVWVFVPGNSGLHGFTVDVDGAGNPTLTNHWNNNNGWTTSVVVANGVVFAARGGGEHSNTTATHILQAVNPTTGAILWTGAIGQFHWASPIVANGIVYMVDGSSGGFGGPGGILRAWHLRNVTSDFTVNVSPSSNTVNAGGSAAYSVTVGSIGGFSGSVALSASGLPGGATSAFVPTSVNGSDSSALTVSTAGTLASGSYPFQITGVSGSTTHSVSATLVVSPGADFSISATPASQTVSAGASTTYAVDVTAIGGFNGSTALSVTGLPAGAAGAFSPASVTGAGSSTLAVTTSASTPTGTFPLTITGTSGTTTHNASVNLVVNVQTGSCVPVAAGAGFTNTPFTAQTGAFTATFDATPAAATTINDVIGLSNGAQNAIAGFAAIVSFSQSGHIVARNGGSYTATNTVNYVAGSTYHFRLVVNVTAHTYSIFVTPPAGAEVTVGSNFAFRTEQAAVTSLNSVGSEVTPATGSLTYCNFTVN